MKKNNISYYSHDVSSHNHWKFKQLRRKYGWAGEGKFWALNNIIGESHNCLLDVSDEHKTEQVATDLDFDVGEFLEYLKFLHDKCRLLKKNGECFTTDQLQENLKTLNRTRVYDKARKNGINKLQ